jgi:hypothetical protein
MATGHCPVCGKAFNFDAFVADIDQKTSTSSISDPTDSEKLVLTDATAGAITLTMPDPVAAVGKKILVKKIDASANIVTIQPHASENFVDDVDYDSIALEFTGDQIVLTSDGIDWIMTGRI